MAHSAPSSSLPLKTSVARTGGRGGTTMSIALPITKVSVAKIWDSAVRTDPMLFVTFKGGVALKLLQGRGL